MAHEKSCSKVDLWNPKENSLPITLPVDVHELFCSECVGGRAQFPFSLVRKQLEIDHALLAQP